MKRKYNFNQEFFSNLDSPEKAYILGLLYSDGCISNSKGSYILFGQSESNKDIVYKVNKILESEYPIHKILRGSKYFYYINLCSDKMFNDLLKFGLEPHKSLTVKFPKEIPDNLLSHFIRGLFDGDGCVWNGKRKEMIVKDPKSSTGLRKRIVHNVKFTYTGNFDFVNSLQDILVDKLGFKKTKLNFSKAKLTKHICTMEYSGRRQLKKFYDFIYKDSTIHGDTKKLKFEEIFCALEGKSSKDTSLIAEIPEMVTSSQTSNTDEGLTTIPEMGVDSSESKCEAPNV